MTSQSSSFRLLLQEICWFVRIWTIWEHCLTSRSTTLSHLVSSYADEATLEGRPLTSGREEQRMFLLGPVLRNPLQHLTLPQVLPAHFRGYCRQIFDHIIFCPYPPIVRLFCYPCSTTPTAHMMSQLSLNFGSLKKASRSFRLSPLLHSYEDHIVAVFCFLSLHSLFLPRSHKLLIEGEHVWFGSYTFQIARSDLIFDLKIFDLFCELNFATLFKLLFV